ncbi:Dynamin [Dactylellina cionopaga]|nr:Dynamin [Dactylellina cionopaga]
MGVPRPGQRLETLPKGKSGFSENLLSIELSGPQHGQFSVTDLPGLIRAVLAANVDVANQEVLQLAKDADSAGERTLGILTKPDRVEAGAESEILRTANNKTYRLALGYFVVRNRGPSELELSRQDRDDVERAFFSQKRPWNTLTKDRVGVNSLKNYLGKLIYERTRHDVPYIQSEIEGHIKACEERLAVLGQPRSSEQEQRRYITAVEVSATAIIDAAFHGRYEKDVFRDVGELKLRQLARSLNKELADAFIKCGNNRAFSATLGPRNEEGGGGDYKDGTFIAIQREDHEILTWIGKIEAKSRGAELPSQISAFIHSTLFIAITQNWQPIAECHFKKMRTITKEFHEAVMRVACKDDYVRQKLSAKHSEGLSRILNDALEELTNIISAERTSILLTENPEFSEIASEFNNRRLIATLGSVPLPNDASSHAKTPPAPDAVRDNILNNVLTSIKANETNDMIATIHDTLRAYYRIARRRIVDGIIVQVFERKVLRRMLQLYNPDWAASLTTDELGALANEPAMTSEERKNVMEDLQIFKEALFTLD